MLQNVLYSHTHICSTQGVVEHSVSSQCGCPEETCRQEPANDEEDPVSRECMICMEEFALGSEVSWSSREEGCTHVYHKECIREWVRGRCFWLLLKSSSY